MAEIWVAATTIVVGAYGADQAGDAAEDQANAIQDGANASTAEERRQYDLARQDQMPWLQAGQDALARQQAFLDGDMSGFENSAGYKFALDQGFQGLNRGAAANGSFSSGGADADRIAYGQGLASQYADNYWNKLAGRAGQGQQTATGLGSLGANMATNIGNNYANAANARASSYGAKADANSQLAAGIGGALNNWNQNRIASQSPQTQQPFAFQPQQQGWQSGASTLGPSNGNAWNFGD